MKPSLAALSAGSRVAGAVVALGYLGGWVSGPLLAVVAGLFLMTFGRCLAVRRSEILPVSAALGIATVALGVGALRWETLDLGFVRGAQAVLGPTVVVGREATVTGSVLAAFACLVSLAVWLAPTKPPGSVRRIGSWIRAVPGWAIEGAPVALAAVTVFWGPKVVAGAGDAAAWVMYTLAFTTAAALLSVVLARLPARLRWLPLTLAAVAGIAGGALVAGTV